eukprot:CAMPEP_0195513382 /NCGR_PEP_ID=MMETSP0794_2-20130614/5047_1 /TAXON_ID=515487 /ORGANISM="Stephanopyxis turris, Strain CCMP 815" /LENGTH=76 /DNA_ID=CAMNT_0040641375 /DNA_START=193 /DNA_END=423 /DNA_ORIENTATION=-
MLPFWKRFGKRFVAVELAALGGMYYIFHDINAGGPEERRKWDSRAPWLIDALYKVTGDERVIDHRRNDEEGRPREE